jgi:hypothetical protein
MSKATGSPILKFGLLALAVLAVVFLVMRMSGGGGEDELGVVPEPKYDPVDPIDPANVIGGDLGGTPVKK